MRRHATDVQCNCLVYCIYNTLGTQGTTNHMYNTNRRVHSSAYVPHSVFILYPNRAYVCPVSSFFLSHFISLGLWVKTSSPRYNQHDKASSYTAMPKIDNVDIVKTIGSHVLSSMIRYVHSYYNESNICRRVYQTPVITRNPKHPAQQTRQIGSLDTIHSSPRVRTHT